MDSVCGVTNRRTGLRGLPLPSRTVALARDTAIEGWAPAVALSVDGAIHFQCIDWRHIGEMLEAGKGTYTELKNICVWSKANAGMPRSWTRCAARPIATR